MTDVRDPETRSTIEEPPRASRQTLVSRALSPIRRVTGRDLATIGEPALDFVGQAQARPNRTAFYLRWSAVVVVLIPMVLTGVYLFFIASNQYVSETSFAVRQAQQSSGKDLSKPDSSSSTMMSGTINLGGEDADIVADYIHSRAIVDDVSRSVDVRAIFSRPEADFLSRLSPHASIEKEVRYWNQMVSVYIESTSGIVTVSVAAFRREDALVLLQAIVRSSERLVNTISLKMRLDAIRTAEDEVRRAEGDYRFAMSNLTAFRNSEHLVDPTQQAASTSKLLMQLMADKIENESKLFVALRVQGPTAPGVSTLRAKLEVDNSQINDLKEQLAGDTTGSKSMANALSRFESLSLAAKFAERMYGFARDGVERARIASIRQQIYLAVFVQPSLPQDYSYPLRWTDFILISLIGLMAWCSGVIITSSVIDHRL